MFFTIHLINMYSSFENNVHTTKQMQYTHCFKVFFLDDVALVCKCLNRFSASFTYNLVESEHKLRYLDFFMLMPTA